MARVTKRNNYEHFDRMLNRFRKAVEKDDVIRTYCGKTFYEKPSAVRKKARAMAVKRHLKKLSNEAKALNELRSFAKE